MIRLPLVILLLAVFGQTSAYPTFAPSESAAPSGSDAPSVSSAPTTSGDSSAPSASVPVAETDPPSPAPSVGSHSTSTSVPTQAMTFSGTYPPSPAPSVGSFSSTTSVPTQAMTSISGTSSVPTAATSSMPTSAVTMPDDGGVACEDEDKETYRVLVFLEMLNAPGECSEADADKVLNTIEQIFNDASNEKLDLRNFHFTEKETRKAQPVLSSPAPTLATTPAPTKIASTPAPTLATTPAPTMAPSFSFAPSVSFAPSASFAPSVAAVASLKATSATPSAVASLSPSVAEIKDEVSDAPSVAETKVEVSEAPSEAPSISAARRRLRVRRDLEDMAPSFSPAPSDTPTLSMPPSVSLAPTDEELDVRAGDSSSSPSASSSTSPSAAPGTRAETLVTVVPTTAAPKPTGAKPTTPIPATSMPATPMPTTPKPAAEKPTPEGVCPMPPLSCPQGSSCEWGCLEVSDCGDSTGETWKALSAKLTAALVALKLPCLGDPSKLNVTVIGPEGETMAPSAGTPTATPTMKPTRFKFKDAGFAIPIKTKVQMTYFPGRGGEIAKDSPTELTLIEEINMFYENFMMMSPYAEIFGGMKESQLETKWDDETRTLALKFQAVVYVADAGGVSDKILAKEMTKANLHDLISMLREKVASEPEEFAEELKHHFTGIQAFTVTSTGKGR